MLLLVASAPGKLPRGRMEELAAAKTRLNAVKLGDGCRHVFLDVGSNRGVHLRFLMEGSDVYDRSRYLQWGYFSEFFGPRYASDPTTCAFAFEPNELHVRRLRHLSMRLRASGRRVEVFHAAASNESGALEFYHRSDELSEANNSIGFGASPEIKKSRNLTHQTIRLPAVDLGLFVATELVNRRIPPPPTQSYTSPPASSVQEVRPPSLLMKLDAEGAELVVLERMRRLGVLCEFGVINIEYHPHRLYPEGGADPDSYASHPELFDLIYHGANSSFDRGHELGSSARHGRWYPLMEKVMAQRRDSTSRAHDTAEHRRAVRACRTRFSFHDDESYMLVHDVNGAAWEPGPAVGVVA